MMEISRNKYYTLEEVADMFGITYQSVYKLVRTGELGAFKIGKNYRVADTDIEGYMKRQRDTMAREVEAQTCSRCGKTYLSASSLTGSCVVCGAPLCMTCVSVDKAVRCSEHEHDSTQNSEKKGE